MHQLAKALITNDTQNRSFTEVSVLDQQLVVVLVLDLRVEELSKIQNVVLQIKTAVCKPLPLLSDLGQQIGRQSDGHHGVIAQEKAVVFVRLQKVVEFVNQFSYELVLPKCDFCKHKHI